MDTNQSQEIFSEDVAKQRMLEDAQFAVRMALEGKFQPAIQTPEELRTESQAIELDKAGAPRLEKARNAVDACFPPEEADQTANNQEHMPDAAQGFYEEIVQEAKLSKPPLDELDKAVARILYRRRMGLDHDETVPDVLGDRFTITARFIVRKVEG